MKTGDYLGNGVAQQGYISTNYTFVARDMAVQGMNVIAQAVAARGDGRRPAAEPVEQPRRGVRGGRKTASRSRPAPAEGRRGQPADALHAQRRRGRPRLL
jgi:type IV secretory pathway TrbL component